MHLIHIANDKGVVLLDGVVVFFTREGFSLYTVKVSVFLKATVTVFMTGQAILGVVCQEKF